MNKIISINLCGIIFQIDESAYDSLKKYLGEIKTHLGSSTSSNEVYQDVESRIAELFQQKISDGAQAILPKDMEEVMQLMGQPEQFKEFAEENKSTQNNDGGNQNQPPFYNTSNPFRRIYRNPDDKVLAGVCSGLAAYFGIDPIIMRLVFVALFFVGGSAFLIYLVCWIAIPKANTSAEKMAMQGKPFTFEHVKQNVQSEAQDVKEHFMRMKNDYVQNRSYSGFTDFARTIFKIIAFAFLILGLMILVPIAIAMIAVFISTGFAIPFAAPTLISSTTHASFIVISIFAIVFIPIAAIIYKLIRLIFNAQQMGNWLKTSLTVVWFGSIVYLFIVAEEVSNDFKHQETVKQEVIFKNTKAKTIYVDVENWQLKKHKKHFNISIFGMHSGRNILFDTLLNANVDLALAAASDSMMHLIINKTASGNTDEAAKQRAEEMAYQPVQKDSVIILPHYFKKAQNQLWRNHHVDLTLQIPFNKPIHFTKEALDLMDEKFFQPQYQDWDDDQIIEQNWVMTSNGLRLAK